MCLSKSRQSILVATVLLLLGCNVNINPAVEKVNEYNVRIQISNKATHEYKIIRGTKTYQQFVQWVKDNENDWSPTPASYVPGVIVSGGDYHFNFIGEMVVLNYPEGQFHKNISKNEYEFLIPKNT
jgi:hypothetical protein